jgi:peptide/nickel transport system substrate-binding protein
MTRFFGRPYLGWNTRVVAALISAALIVGACGSTPAASPAASTAATSGASAAPSTAATASAAGSKTIENIKVAGAGPVLTLDVTKSGDLVSVDTIILTQGNLYRHNAAGVAQPELADGLPQVSADGKTVTIKLKPNLKYSDGSPVKAADIKAAIDRQLNKGANLIFINSVVSATVVDDLTATLTLKYPDPDLINGLSARAIALNPADKLASDPDYLLHPVSAGPYMVTEFTPNKSIHLAENPNYVGGPMVVKGIDILYVPDLTSKVLQLATGALDFVWDLPIAAKDSLPPEVKQFTIEVGGANTLYLNMNPKGKAGTKFADPRVRQAMSLAINRQAIADKAFAGLVKPLTSFWYDCPDICPKGMLPNGGKQDVEAAKKLMADAGVPADGIKAEMLVSSTRGGWKDGATLVAQDLEAIGVHFTVNPVDEATWNGAVAADNFEAVFNGGASSPQITMSSWFGNGFSAMHSGYNLIPDHDKVVALIDKMAQETDKAKRLDLMTQIQTFGRDTMPMISLVERIALDGTRLPDGVLSVANQTPGYIIMQTVKEQSAGMGAGK